MTPGMEALLKQVLRTQEQNSSALAAQKEITSSLRRDLDAVAEDVRGIRDAVQRIEVMAERRASVAQCSYPNLCVELKEQIDKLAATVGTLVENRAETRGAMRAATAVAAVLGSIGGAVLTYIVKKIT